MGVGVGRRGRRRAEVWQHRVPGLGRFSRPFGGGRPTGTHGRASPFVPTACPVGILPRTRWPVRNFRTVLVRGAMERMPRSIPAGAGRASSICRPASWPAVGVSPRTRGEVPRLSQGQAFPRWLIPAWAGRTLSTGYALRRASVYPRACGEDDHRLSSGKILYGLSPHTRGRLLRKGAVGLGARFIPAYAGKPLIRYIPGNPGKVLKV